MPKDNAKPAGVPAESGRAIASPNSGAFTVVDKIRFLVRIAGDQRLAGTDIRCAILIVDYYNTRKGHAWPSYDRLAQASGASRASVHRSITKLDDLGIIRRTSGHKGRSNDYVPDFQIEAGETVSAARLSHQRDVDSLTDETVSVAAMRPNPSTIPRSNQRRGDSSSPAWRDASAEAAAPARGSLKRSDRTTGGGQGQGADHEAPAGFIAFWEAYPKKEGRKQAIAAYRRALAGGVEPALLVSKAAQYAAAKSHVSNPLYVKFAGNWLDESCWLEDPQPPKAQGPRGNQSSAKAAKPAKKSRRKSKAAEWRVTPPLRLSDPNRRTPAEIARAAKQVEREQAQEVKRAVARAQTKSANVAKPSPAQTVAAPVRSTPPKQTAGAPLAPPTSRPVKWGAPAAPSSGATDAVAAYRMALGMGEPERSGALVAAVQAAVAKHDARSAAGMLD